MIIATIMLHSTPEKLQVSTDWGLFTNELLLIVIIRAETDTGYLHSDT